MLAAALACVAAVLVGYGLLSHTLPAAPPEPMGSVTTTASCPDLGGQGRIDATHPSGASITLCTHGGHLVSWKTASDDEMLYVSPTAVYGPPKAIRGGVPICFPQFGKKGPITAQHGFARNSPWAMVGSTVSDSATTVTMQLTKETLRTAGDTADCPEWPHDFTLQITYAINATSLKMTAEVRAPTEGFEMGLLFHTYLRVGDIKQTEITGLQSLSYFPNGAGDSATPTLEKLDNGEDTLVEQRDVSDFPLFLLHFTPRLLHFTLFNSVPSALVRL